MGFNGGDVHVSQLETGKNALNKLYASVYFRPCVFIIYFRNIFVNVAVCACHVYFKRFGITM